MYETELMRQILKSKMAQKMIQEISPRYGKAYVFLHLMQVTGLEWDDLIKWTEELAEQVVPQTATWGIDYWEMEYGITPKIDWEIERRRANVLLRMQIRGPMNPTRLAEIVSVAIGAPVRIEENTGKNHFKLYVSSTPYLVKEENVRAAVKPAKPVRLIYDVIFERYVRGQVYTGGTLYAGKFFTLRRL